ncbi:TPR repeat protein [Methylohalomonas lacus]|uniref:TPR repeat protein n=1 Tax=Methylohalomonas lacus TaxID=398773 RepID=A0AAE3HK15_9GAMM|nr:hypothetical protein [Methylohalomonas lacus]MCS3903780.1 TPR repeat protein [Methylohalomonas lacus]
MTLLSRCPQRTLLCVCLLLPITAFAADLEALRERAEAGSSHAQTELGYLYHTGEGVEQDYQVALDWYRRAAEQGQPDAQYNLGVAYAFGHGVDPDPVQASEWYRRAAEHGQPVAAFSLGLAHLQGDGVRKDPLRAAELFQQAGESGYARAQVHLGSLYHTGNSVPQDYELAAYWYQQAAERGDATAQYNLANLYRAGRGVPRDADQARRWYQSAAEQDYELARTALAEMSQDAAANGDTRPPRRIVSPPLPDGDAETAADTAVEATTPAQLSGVQAGDAAMADGFADSLPVIAEDDTAEVVETGPVTDTEPGEQTPESEQPGFFSRLFGGTREQTDTTADPAAEENNTAASNSDWVEPLPAPATDAGSGSPAPDTETDEQPDELAETIAHAEAALATGDYRSALDALQREALAGNAAAESRLGDLYFNGKGVERNPDRALLWYRRAAKRGYADAQYQLGNMHRSGKGVLKDNYKARDWYALAAEQGHDRARERLETLEQQLAEKRRYQPESHDSASGVQIEQLNNDADTPPLATLPDEAADSDSDEQRAAPAADTDSTPEPVREAEPATDNKPAQQPPRAGRVVTPPIETGD